MFTTETISTLVRDKIITKNEAIAAMKEMYRQMRLRANVEYWTEEMNR
jgi:hypothetical protein